jgi:DNA polymerase-3 subunit delta'
MFETIVGQERVKKFFRRVFSEDKLSHSYIFAGKDGIGKSAVAFELAKALNCPNNNCGKCSDCKQVLSLQHQNLHLVFPLPSVEKGEKNPIKSLSESELEQVKNEISQKAKNPYHQISVSKAREILIQSVRNLASELAFSIPEHNYSVVIFFQADKLNQNSANAFLKLLEEPPQKTLFILITESPKTLLPTILSRCQLVRFDLLSEDEIKNYLLEKGFSEEESKKASKLAGGSLQTALEIVNLDLRTKFEEALNFLRVVVVCEPTQVLDLAKNLSKREKNELESLFKLTMNWFRDCLLLKAERTDKHLVFETYRENLQKFSQRYHFANENQAIEVLEKGIFSINRNVYVNLLLTDLIVQLNRAILPR